MSTSGGQQTIFLKSPALTREINRIGYAAMDIRNAIANKGVTVPNNAKIEDYADLIDSIAIDVTTTKVAYSTFTTLPSIIENADWSSAANLRYMFYYCSSLTTVPLLDTSNATNMEYMFAGCTNLTTVPAFNTSNVSRMNYMFNYCTHLTTVPTLNASSINNISNMFNNCTALTTLGGLTNLGQAYLTSKAANSSDYKLDLSVSTNITHDSLVNVINGLYDIATAGCNTQQLVLGSTNLAKLTAEEIAIATNKGWSVS